MSQPSPTKQAIAQGYDAIADKLGMPPKFNRLCVNLLRGRLAPNARVIDVGCGQGQLLIALREALPGAEIFGSDISFKLAGMSQGRLGRPAIFQADIEHLPIASGQFDAVMMTEVLEHLLAPDEALRQLNRILKPGGWLLMSIPNRDWFRYEEYETKRRRFQPVDDHWYSVGEVRSLLTSGGFTLRKLRGAENLYFGGGLPHLLEKLALLCVPALQGRMKRAVFLAQKTQSFPDDLRPAKPS